MPVARWFPISIEQTAVPGGFIIVLTTDTACHLFLLWSWHPPWVHRISSVQRGLPYLWESYWCFVAWYPIEQEETGDTTTHTFTWLSWLHCQTKYFRFHGTIATVDSPSDSPILHKHYTAVTPPPAPLYYEPWTWKGSDPPSFTREYTEPWTS